MEKVTEQRQLDNLRSVHKDLGKLINELETMLNHYEFAVSVLVNNRPIAKPEIPSLAGSVISNLKSDSQLFSLLFKGQISHLKLFNQCIRKDADMMEIFYESDC